MQAHKPKIKVGQINFTNCLPINYPLARLIESKNSLYDFTVTEGVPRELNQIFREGTLDLAPISSYEYLSNKDSCLLMPGLSISSKKNADSVLLFVDEGLGLDGLRRIYLTNKSASSVNLLKILLSDYWGFDLSQIEFVDFDLSQNDMPAKLLIGDEALIEAYKNRNYTVYDLGEIWHEFSSGLPMVFGLWTVSKRSQLAGNSELFAQISSLFLDLKQQGLDDYLPDVVVSAYQKTGLPRSLLKNYFNNLDYNFGDRHQESLELFERKLKDHKLIQELACK